MLKKAHIFVILIMFAFSVCPVFCRAGGDDSGSDEVISLTKQAPSPSAVTMSASAATGTAAPAAAAVSSTASITSTAEPAATTQQVTGTAVPEKAETPAVKKTKTGRKKTTKVKKTAEPEATVSPEQQKIKDLVAQVKNKQSGRKAMTCDIVIKTSYGSSGAPQEVRGTVVIKKKDKFKVHYTQPTEQFLVSNGKKLWVYTPGLKQVIVQASKDAALDTNFYIEIENSIEYFVNNSRTTLVEDDKIYTLTMVPVDKKKLDFDEISVKIQKDGLIPQYMSMKFEGSLMEVLFSNIVNYSPDEAEKSEDLANRNFDFITPAGVEEIEASSLIDAATGK
jgi:chaperone LolA